LWEINHNTNHKTIEARTVGHTNVVIPLKSLDPTNIVYKKCIWIASPSFKKA